MAPRQKLADILAVDKTPQIGTPDTNPVGDLVTSLESQLQGKSQSSSLPPTVNEKDSTAPAKAGGFKLGRGGSRGTNSISAQIGGILEEKATKYVELQSKFEDLKEQFLAGKTIVELDPDLIDSSFVSDRLGGSEEEAAEFLEQVRSQGQLVPILVRPHPEHQGRYQVAFGHRRLNAVRQLGRKVRAVVANLTDEELVIAQGQENSARLDLTFIEKARFARKIELSGISRNVITRAMKLNHVTQVNYFINVVENIPDEVLIAIGRAPKIGRPRWTELSRLLRDGALAEEARHIVQRAEFQSLCSDDRFHYVLAEVSKVSGGSNPGATTVNLPEAKVWESPQGHKLASFNYTKDRCTVQFDRRSDPDFSEFLYSKLGTLYQEYKAAMENDPADE